MARDRGAGSSMSRHLGWLGIFSVATNILMLAVPIHMMQVYDRVLSSQSAETLFYLTLVVIGALAVFGAAEAIRSMIAQRLSAGFAAGFAGDMFDGLISGRQTGADHQQILRDFSQLRAFLSGRQIIGLFDLPFAPLFLVLMFLLHTVLGVLSLLGMLVLIIIAFANQRATSSMRETASHSHGEAHGFAQNALQRAEDIRAMGLLANVMNGWGHRTSEALNASDAAAQRSAVFFGLSRFVRQSLQVLMMAIGAYLVILGDMSGGVIFAASMISSRALMPIEQVIGGWTSIAQARSAYQRLTAFTANRPGSPPPVALPEPKGVITVEKLGFETGAGSMTGKAILQDISFTLKPGSILAVIGPSGAGKSTLARLMAGAATASGGEVRLDGFALEQWGDRVRGNAIGYVPQDIALFPGTLAENIARLDPQPDDRRIIAAAIKADVHDMIARLPDGYQTVVGSVQHGLSGGQRQRIALARAFYSRPRVLILDEPNAHLDQAGETRLMGALEAARADGLSVLIVTQRRSLLQICDRVMVLKEGRIASLKPREAFEREMKTTGPVTPEARIHQMARHRKPASAPVRLHVLDNSHV